MDITQIILFSAGSFVIGAGIAMALARLMMKKRADSILKAAQEEAENIKKEKIFQAKERFLQLKSEHDQHIAEKNRQMAEAENRLHTIKAVMAATLG